MVEMSARVRIPRSVAIGDDIEIKTLVQHPMQNGLFPDGKGGLIPRVIIHTFEATFNGETILKADLDSGVATNPFFAFNYRVTGPGEFLFRWEDDHGDVVEVVKSLNPVS